LPTMSVMKCLRPETAIYEGHISENMIMAFFHDHVNVVMVIFRGLVCYK